MKASLRTLTMIVCAVVMISCHSLFPGATGRLILTFESNQIEIPYESASLRANTSSERLSIPKTDDFILSLSDSKGKVIYEGLFKDSPEIYELSPGSYSVKVVSCEFDTPNYSTPQFGDSKVVVVKSNETLNVALSCAQLNCGLRLNVEDSFRDTFPDGELILSSSDGALVYSYDESRTAYFLPNSIKVSLNDLGMEQLLFTRNLSARQMLCASLSCSSSSSAKGVSIQVDTSRNYIDENYIYGETPGSDIDNALSVSQARLNTGSKGQWVCGYIVGCAIGTSSYAFAAPFTKATNILIALRSSTTDVQYCLSVELKSGAIRDALNLMDNPELKGKKVYLKGDIVASYFGIPGLKNLSEYCF